MQREVSDSRCLVLRSQQESACFHWQRDIVWLENTIVSNLVTGVTPSVNVKPIDCMTLWVWKRGACACWRVLPVGWQRRSVSTVTLVSGPGCHILALRNVARLSLDAVQLAVYAVIVRCQFSPWKFRIIKDCAFQKLIACVSEVVKGRLGASVFFWLPVLRSAEKRRARGSRPVHRAFTAPGSPSRSCSGFSDKRYAM